MAVGLLKLRAQMPGLKRPFRAWTPAVFVKMALAVALLAAPFFRPREGREGGMFYATYAVVGWAM